MAFKRLNWFLLPKGLCRRSQPCHFSLQPYLEAQSLRIHSANYDGELIQCDVCPSARGWTWLGWRSRGHEWRIQDNAFQAKKLQLSSKLWEAGRNTGLGIFLALSREALFCPHLHFMLLAIIFCCPSSLICDFALTVLFPRRQPPIRTGCLFLCISRVLAWILFQPLRLSTQCRYKNVLFKWTFVGPKAVLIWERVVIKKKKNTIMNLHLKILQVNTCFSLKVGSSDFYSTK